ncbi:ComEC/Rec2 family competence protein [Chloroflexota bacterium]
MNFFTKRPFFLLGVFSIAVILLVDRFQISLYPWLILNAILLLFGIQFFKYIQKNGDDYSSRPLFILVIIIIFLVGVRYISVQPVIDQGNIAWYNDTDGRVTLTGWVQSSPDERDGFSNLRVNITNISFIELDSEVDGLILVRVPPNNKYHVGDVIRFEGYLKTPPEDEGFSYKDYLVRQGILSMVSTTDVEFISNQGGNAFVRTTFRIKETLLSTLRVLFPEPENSLLAGILLGEDKGMTADLQDAFRNTGTTHIIAISGFNITILVALFITIFNRLLGRWWGAFASIISIIIYTILVGADASVIRAAIMGGTAIIAAQLGRSQDGLNTLGFAVAVMCLLDPYLPWDVGFQLSFAATLGLILYAKPLQDLAIRWLSRMLPKNKAKKWASPLAEYLLYTLAAQVTTLPLIAWHFGQISLTSFLVNPLILPAQPPVMIASGIAVLLGAIYIPLGKLLAWLAWPFSMYTIRMVELFDKIPHGIIHLGEFSFLFVALFYLLLFGITFAPAILRDKIRSQLKPAAAFTILGLVVILVWKTTLALPDGNLNITFLNVSGGNAILIQTTTGKNILINGGSSRSELANALGRRFSPFGRYLDALIVASTKENQTTSLPAIVEQFPPELVLWSGLASLSDSAYQLNNRLISSGTKITQAESGLTMDLGDEALLKVMSVNDNGMVLLVSWNDFIALLPIEMSFEDLSILSQDPNLTEISVFLIPAAGYLPLNPPEWINRLAPNLAILAGTETDLNRTLEKEILTTFKPYTLLSTDQTGWIKISTDGVQLWVETEHN